MGLSAVAQSPVFVQWCVSLLHDCSCRLKSFRISDELPVNSEQKFDIWVTSSGRCYGLTQLVTKNSNSALSWCRWLPKEILHL